MATYAIGDVQGCFNTLQALLHHIQFDAANDQLWFAGDIVNRGPRSLETLRFIKALGPQHVMVLGNHDLHLLARGYGQHPGWQEDTLSDILEAPDKTELLAWLSKQPLMHYDPKKNFCLVHAGIAATWDLAKASALAREVEHVLQSDQARDFFAHMYGNEPELWRDDLTGWDRLRCITNYFTRLRFCHADGRIELTHKGVKSSAKADHIPWFNVPTRVNKDLRIAFGHWAALGGVTDTPNAYALDTGCVWGYDLTALRLEDGQRFSVKSCDV